VNLNTGTVKLTDLASCGAAPRSTRPRGSSSCSPGFVPGGGREPARRARAGDDAAVYRLDDERGADLHARLLPPVVDDPSDYGAIAGDERAQRRLRDGRDTPLLHCRSRRSRGASDADARRDLRGRRTAGTCCGGLLAGGHTIRDASRSTGSPSSGRAPDASGRRTAPGPGDALFLTKPLGTGLIMSGYKRGRRRHAAARARVPLDAHAEQGRRGRAARLEPNAVTDVTGFGLFGHAHEVAERSGVRIRLESERFPRSTARSTSRAGRAHERRSAQPRLRRPHVELDGVPETLVALGYDPQTAGGLLVSSRRARRRARGGVRAREALHPPVGRVEEGAGVVVGEPVRPGMIHGRFQPFHNGHLEYLRAPPAAATRSSSGSRTPTRRGSSPRTPTRCAPARVEPVQLRRAAADGEGGRARRGHRARALHVIPFPVNEPELWAAYVPTDVVQFIRLFSDWGGTKLGRLRDAGYEVVVLDEGAEKELSGAEVRAALRTAATGRRWFLRRRRVLKRLERPCKSRVRRRTFRAARVLNVQYAANLRGFRMRTFVLAASPARTRRHRRLAAGVDGTKACTITATASRRRTSRSSAADAIKWTNKRHQEPPGRRNNGASLGDDRAGTELHAHVQHGGHVQLPRRPASGLTGKIVVTGRRRPSRSAPRADPRLRPVDAHLGAVSKQGRRDGDRLRAAVRPAVAGCIAPLLTARNGRLGRRVKPTLLTTTRRTGRRTSASRSASSSPRSRSRVTSAGAREGQGRTARSRARRSTCSSSPLPRVGEGQAVILGRARRSASARLPRGRYAFGLHVAQPGRRRLPRRLQPHVVVQAPGSSLRTRGAG
jgi:selenide,water dikinase